MSLHDAYQGCISRRWRGTGRSTSLPKMSDWPSTDIINRFRGSILTPPLLSTLLDANSSTASDLPPSALTQLWHSSGLDVMSKTLTSSTPFTHRCRNLTNTDVVCICMCIELDRKQCLISLGDNSFRDRFWCPTFSAGCHAHCVVAILLMLRPSADAYILVRLVEVFSHSVIVV